MGESKMDQCTHPLPQDSLKSLSLAAEPAMSSSDADLQVSGSSSEVTAHRTTQQCAELLGGCASKAMKKALRKMLRHEKAVLKDADIEALHQMRIGLRRLRTTIVTFEQVLDFPESVRDVTLKPLAKRLGRVRDLDVLLLTLRDRHRPHLPKKERKALDRVLKGLQSKRDHQFKRMKHFLRSRQYQTIQDSIKLWCRQLKTAQHTPDQAASWSMQATLPDLLLPVLSQTLLHPGWLAVPPDMSLGLAKGETDAKAIAQVNRWLDREGTILHDLRKQMKQLRYQADFFASHYDAHYRQQIKDFKLIQDVLGTLQDTWVLAQMLQRVDGASWAKHLPALYKQMQQDRWQAWQEWEKIRETYTTVEMRSHLRQMMLTPVSSK